MTDMERKQCGDSSKQLLLDFGQGFTCGGCGCSKSDPVPEGAEQGRAKSEELFQNACQELHSED